MEDRSPSGAYQHVHAPVNHFQLDVVRIELDGANESFSVVGDGYLLHNLPTPIATKQNNTNGPARANIERGSPLGVKTADATVMAMIV